MIIGRIYKLTDHTMPNTLYIGSTTKPSIKNRLWYHKCDYNRYLKGNYCYVTSFEIIKNGNYSIELIEEVEIENQKELLKKEIEHILKMRETSNVVNMYPKIQAMKKLL